MNRLFGTFFDSPTASAGSDVAGRRWIPAMDLVEGEDSYVLRADLPGLGEDDVKIEFEDNVLTISGARKTEREQRKGGYVRYERASGQFTRSLTLPAGVDAGSIEASFGSGVLEVRIPKPAERQPQRISIGTRAVEGVEVAAPDAEAAETTAVAA
jgi:HSP20 family protein